MRTTTTTNRSSPLARPAAKSATDATTATNTSSGAVSVVDIGINLTNAALKKKWKTVIERARHAGVHQILLTGTSRSESQKSLNLAQQWSADNQVTAAAANDIPTSICCKLYCTVGVHPHYAKTYNKSTTTAKLQELLQHPLAVAVGECGLDYNRNFSSKEDQLVAFREQVLLACRLDIPLFVHEREAHEDLLRVMDDVQRELAAADAATDNYSNNKSSLLPPVVIHCFTGTQQEAQTYIERGFFLGFTGTICKKERGASLRKLLPYIPLDRIMIETDAPFMGFIKGRRGSEPADVVGVAKQLSETMGVTFETVCEVTTRNAEQFFRLNKDTMR